MNTEEKLTETLTELHGRLTRSFALDPATKRNPGKPVSSGNCGAAAVIIQALLGGETLATKIVGPGHWLNRIEVQGEMFDIDLTGDQFKLPAIQIAAVGEIYPDAVVTKAKDLDPETLARALEFAEAAGLDKAVVALEELLEDVIPTRGLHALMGREPGAPRPPSRGSRR